MSRLSWSPALSMNSLREIDSWWTSSRSCPSARRFASNETHVKLADWKSPHLERVVETTEGALVHGGIGLGPEADVLPAEDCLSAAGGNVVPLDELMGAQARAPAPCPPFPPAPSGL